jgi:hypothetical protein
MIATASLTCTERRPVFGLIRIGLVGQHRSFVVTAGS